MTYTSLKIKRRKTTLVGKQSSLFIQLIRHRRIRRISLDIWVYEDEWLPFEEKLRPTEKTGGSRSQYLSVGNERICKARHMIGLLIRQLESRGDYTVDELVVAYHERNRASTLFEYMDLLAEKLKNSGRTATCHHYRSLRNSLAAFIKTKKIQKTDLAFNELTVQLIADYEQFLLGKKLMPNTVSFYLRLLRSVWNKAAEDKLVEHHGSLFRHVNTRIEKTKKRAVSPAVLKKVIGLSDRKLKNSASLRLCVDLFLFSYYTRGMAFVDIAHLTKQNIHAGILTYTRRKTGQEMKIKILPEIQAIIDKYTNKHSDYLFPVLETLGGTDRKYESALRLQNLHLKTISKIVGAKLSTYTSRHTWASMAKTKGVPEELISEGMGHNSLETTHIYMTLLDDSIIDRINEYVTTGRISKGKWLWRNSVSW